MQMKIKMKIEMVAVVVVVVVVVVVNTNGTTEWLTSKVCPENKVRGRNRKREGERKRFSLGDDFCIIEKSVSTSTTEQAQQQR